MEKIAQINSMVNGLVWGVPAMALILGIGIYLTFGTRFIQVRKFGLSMKEILGKLFTKKAKSSDEAGSVTPFQALCTALASTVGTGNIAGVAGAIALGGPGAVFWMWVSAFLGMCTKFSEVSLALMYRERNKEGDWVGGPMYYIKNGLGKKWIWLAYLFAIFGAITVFGTGNATQVNTIIDSINTALINFNVIPEANKTINLVIAIVIAISIAMVLIGGIKRIGTVTERLVPFMAVLYIILGLGVIIINIAKVPAVFGMIFSGAFSPRGATGGIVGSMYLTMQKGVGRGIFSNEAGLGTASIAHASSSNKDPLNQGLFGIFEVFMDTIVVCTMTALIILTGVPSIVYGEAAGASLTISGLTNTYGGWVSIFTAVALCSFAYSTILGWGLYGRRCFEFIFGFNSGKVFLVLYSIVAIAGAVLDLGLMWDLCDTFNGLMTIPNLIAVALLSPKLLKAVKDKYK